MSSNHKTDPLRYNSQLSNIVKNRILNRMEMAVIFRILVISEKVVPKLQIGRYCHIRLETIRLFVPGGLRTLPASQVQLSVSHVTDWTFMIASEVAVSAGNRIAGFTCRLCWEKYSVASRNLSLPKGSIGCVFVLKIKTTKGSSSILPRPQLSQEHLIVIQYLATYLWELSLDSKAAILDWSHWLRRMNN